MRSRCPARNRSNNTSERAASGPLPADSASVALCFFLFQGVSQRGPVLDCPCVTTGFKTFHYVTRRLTRRSAIYAHEFCFSWSRLDLEHAHVHRGAAAPGLPQHPAVPVRKYSLSVSSFFSCCFLDGGLDPPRNSQ